MGNRGEVAQVPMKINFSGSSKTVSKDLFILAWIILTTALISFPLGNHAHGQEPDARVELGTTSSDVTDKVHPVVPAEDSSDQNLDSEKGGPTTADEPARRFTSTHAVQLLTIATLIIWGYSLVMSGKHGMGWMVLASILGVLAYFGRLFRSMFQEVTSENEVKDWEDE
jgi:hypothetical protein